MHYDQFFHLVLVSQLLHLKVSGNSEKKLKAAGKNRFYASSLQVLFKATHNYDACNI